MQKGQVLIFLLVGILILAAASGAYYLGKSQSTEPAKNIPASPEPSSQSIPPQTTTTTTPSPTNKPTVTNQRTDWLTYTDTKAGFSIQYPSTMKINELIAGQKVEFLNCGGGPCLSGMKIVLYNDYTGGSRKEWLNGKFDLSTYSPYYEDLNVAGVNALVAATRDPGSNNTVFVVIPKENNVWLYNAPGDAISASQKPNLNEDKEILSTFKFLP